MNDLDGKVKNDGTEGYFDFDYIIDSMNQFALINEEKASSSHFTIVRWWHNRIARKERSNAVFIQKIRDRHEHKRI